MHSNTSLGGREGERIISSGNAGELNRCSLEYAEIKKARDADCQSASQEGEKESEHFQSMGRWMEREGKSRICKGRSFSLAAGLVFCAGGPGNW